MQVVEQQRHGVRQPDDLGEQLGQRPDLAFGLLSRLAGDHTEALVAGCDAQARHQSGDEPGSVVATVEQQPADVGAVNEELAAPFAEQRRLAESARCAD